MNNNQKPEKESIGRRIVLDWLSGYGNVLTIRSFPQDLASHIDAVFEREMQKVIAGNNAVADPTKNIRYYLRQGSHWLAVRQGYGDIWAVSTGTGNIPPTMASWYYTRERAERVRELVEPPLGNQGYHIVEVEVP